MHINASKPVKHSKTSPFHNQKLCALLCALAAMVLCSYGTMPTNFVIDTEGGAVQTLDN